MYKIKNNNLILTLPLKVKRFNPYMDMIGEDPYTGMMSNIVGIIDGQDVGFGFWIDFDYAGKPDQNTGILFHWPGSQEDFEEFCKNNISIIYEADNL
uniref:Uncharacterized protein n=2 Tax=viral metagenome TaxID=1070528 RepID=A0A6M3XZ12_9ZZZZ